MLKVVNTGQYESEWSIENSEGRFMRSIAIFVQVLCSIYRNRKNSVLFQPTALFMVGFPSQDLNTEFCIIVHAPNTSFSCIIKGRIE